MSLVSQSFTVDGDDIKESARGLARACPPLQAMIRKLASGEYRLYSRKKDPKTGKRKNLGTFKSRAAAEKHERAVQYFKRA
jgi:hypothetical protein